MIFDKYKTYSLMDDKPIMFKHESYWLAFWNGELMPAEIALAICSKYYWRTELSRECCRRLGDLYIELRQYDWFLESTTPVMAATLVGWMTKDCPPDTLEMEPGNIIYAIECRISNEILNKSYDHSNVYKWFKGMLSNE